MAVRIKIRNDIMRMGGDIVLSERFHKARNLRHHTEEGNVASHSLSTAEYALRISRWLERRGVKVNERDAVRASLMHDLGMTEDEVFGSPSSEKAHTHPEEGSRIAAEEFDANAKQTDAVLHHMWPIGGTPPHSSEGWIVVAADKVTSINEVRLRTQHMIRENTVDKRPHLSNLPDTVRPKARALKKKLPNVKVSVSKVTTKLPTKPAVRGKHDA